MIHVLIWWLMMACGFQILPFVLKYYILSLNHFPFCYRLVRHGAEYYLHSWIHDALGSSILSPSIALYRAFESWYYPTISSSVVPLSSCPQSFPASGSFPVSQLSTSGGQSIGVSASTSVLPMNTQDWSPSGWTNWISLQSKGLSRIFSNTTVQKYQFFSAHLSL